MRRLPSENAMKDAQHANADLAKLGELIDGVEIAMLTTHAADGSMVSRPLQTLKFDANGDVNIAYAHPGEQRYVSVRGTARIDRDRATIDELWSATQRVFFAEGKDDPNLAVLRVHVRDAAYWESAGNFVARALDFARGILGGEPSDLGQHGRLSGSD